MGDRPDADARRDAAGGEARRSGHAAHASEGPRLIKQMLCFDTVEPLKSMTCIVTYMLILTIIVIVSCSHASAPSRPKPASAGRPPPPPHRRRHLMCLLLLLLLLVLLYLIINTLIIKWLRPGATASLVQSAAERGVFRGAASFNDGSSEPVSCLRRVRQAEHVVTSPSVRSPSGHLPVQSQRLMSLVC